MRTMASVWFSVLVLVSVQKVFGNVCLDNGELSCDDCVRCGGNWCKERRSPHCVFSLEDHWCPDDQEFLTELPELSVPGKLVSPAFVERTLYIMKSNTLDIEYPAKPKQKVNLIIHNSTQSFNINLKAYEPKCYDTKCKVAIEAIPLRDFCSTTSSTKEFVFVTINVGLSEDVLVKYHVACACDCSQIVEINSEACSNNGDLSCGVCSCHKGWAGKYCNQSYCVEKRGDVQCTNPAKNDVDCSGNGYCDSCETCICYTDREGSQYFDQDNYCTDLCMVTSECEDCLLNNTIGECYSCSNDITLQRYNQSLTEVKDQQGRKVWVACNETIDNCRIDYFTKRAENRKIYVMVERSCNDMDAAAIIGTPNVSIILGVLGIVAAVAAVGGVMLWKHMNAIPPVPLNDPQYQNIDAEDCTGENPLYKPPTSSFKNPTYGKW